MLTRDLRLPAPYAALANSLTAHAFDYDDTHEKGDMHAYSVVLPAALAAAEVKGKVSGADFLAAVTVGVDVAYRIGLGIKRYRGWHPTATCGIFGAAIAAGRVLGLDRAQLHNAMGIAYSLSSGNFQCILDGSLTKRLQPSFSSRAAVEAVMLARIGITGAKNVLEGKFGFFPLYEWGEYNKEPLRDRLGTWFEGEAASMKPYPSCRFCHGTVDAILEIRKEASLKPEDVDSIEVKMPGEAHDYVGGPFVIGDTPQVSAQFNTAYNVAAALMFGAVGLKELDPKVVTDPKMMALAQKVTTVPTPDPYGFGPQDIMVKTRAGKTFKKHVTVMKGHPDNPMTEAECMAKLKDCIRHAGWKPETAEKLKAWLAGLDRAPDAAGGLIQMMAEGRR